MVLPFPRHPLCEVYLPHTFLEDVPRPATSRVYAPRSFEPMTQLKLPRPMKAFHSLP